MTTRQDTREAPNAWKRAPHSGYGSWHAWVVSLWADNDESMYRYKLHLFEMMRKGARNVKACWSDYITDALVMTRRGEHEYVYLNRADVKELYECFLYEYREYCEYQDKEGK